MALRKGRILLGKLGKGHKGAMLNLAKGLSEAGFEVIFRISCLVAKKYQD